MLALQNLVDYFHIDIGIDLGTANSLVYVKGEGIVLTEPSVVAINEAGDVVAVGSEAKKMLGRTPGSITAIRPMKDGVIADFDVTQEMLSYFIRRVLEGRGHRHFIRPRVVVSVPTGITAVERRAVKESALMAGARSVILIEEPMAAAIGARLPKQEDLPEETRKQLRRRLDKRLHVNEAIGSMVIDIGGGTTEVAVVSLGAIVESESVRCAGDAMDDAIIQHVKRKYNLMIGPRTAEDIKIHIGSAEPLVEELLMEIKGRDLMTGLPRIIDIHSQEVRDALWEPISTIINAVKLTLEKTPPELAGDIVERGICMAGGSSQLRGLPEVIARETRLPVYLCTNPETAIVEGTGRVLEGIEVLTRTMAMK
ncbi:MAG: rod shape-determining protein [Sumerlaeia bacterium]